MSGLSFEIGNRRIGEAEPCYIIAEVGINHDGDPELAKELLVAAAECGADAVKLQIVDAEAAYMSDTASYREFADRGLSFATLVQLMEEADKLGIHLFATPGDPNSLDVIVRLGMPAVKISSGLMTNTLMLRQAARAQLPLIVSTGMADLADVQWTVAILNKAEAVGFALLHCRSQYPSAPEDANLKAIDTLKSEFPVPIGYSDHCIGNLASLAAVVLGATVLEKHFTLDPNRPGADHALSSDPGEFAELVRQLRTMEAMLGDGIKQLNDEEAASLSGRHRYLIAAKDLRAGDQITENMLAAKRTVAGYGIIPAQDVDAVVGKRLKVPLAQGGAVHPDQLEQE